MSSFYHSWKRSIYHNVFCESWCFTEKVKYSNTIRCCMDSRKWISRDVNLLHIWSSCKTTYLRWIKDHISSNVKTTIRYNKQREIRHEIPSSSFNASKRCQSIIS